MTRSVSSPWTIHIFLVLTAALASGQNYCDPALCPNGRHVACQSSGVSFSIKNQFFWKFVRNYFDYIFSNFDHLVCI